MEVMAKNIEKCKCDDINDNKCDNIDKDKFDSVCYECLKESFKFGSTIKGEELLKKLYIDIVCKHEICVRDRNLKEVDNNSEFVTNLYIIDDKHKIGNIPDEFIEEIEAINNLNAYKIKNNIEVFYKSKHLHSNFNNNEKYYFEDTFWKEKKVEDGWKFNKDYQCIYAKFSDKKEDEQIKSNLIYYKDKKTKTLLHNQLAIYIDTDNCVKCIGSNEIKMKFEKELNQKWSISTKNGISSKIKDKNTKNCYSYKDNNNKFINAILDKESIDSENFKKAFLINNKFIGYNEIYLYENKDIDNTTSSTISYCSEIDYYEIESDNIIYCENNKKYLKINFKNNRNKPIEINSHIKFKEDTDIILKDNNQYYSLSNTNNYYLKKSLEIESITIDIIYPDSINITESKLIKKNHIVMVNYDGYKNDYAMILGRLRNAIAHSRIELIDDNYLFFTNKNKEKVNLLAKIDIDKINQFICELSLLIDKAIK